MIERCENITSLYYPFGSVLKIFPVRNGNTPNALGKFEVDEGAPLGSDKVRDLERI